MKLFTAEFAGNTIEVRNSAFHEYLYVNGRLQDHAWGVANRSLLWGRCTNEEGKEVTLKVRIGGLFTMSCDIFADDCLIMSNGTMTIGHEG